MIPSKQQGFKQHSALQFLLKLLLLLCLLKTIFFVYNYSLGNGWAIHNFQQAWKVGKWSLLYDVFTILIINIPLLLLLMIAGKKLQRPAPSLLVAVVFAALNTLMIFLNTVDIFYYRFHLQRADADLMYVLRNPFDYGTVKVWLLLLAMVAFLLLTARYFYKNIFAIIFSDTPKRSLLFTSIAATLLLILFVATGVKKILPTYPLTQLQAVQLPLAQNSFHHFLYSLYRKSESSIPNKEYMSRSEQEKLFSIQKINSPAGQPRNIVLFIMESVPAAFFDSSSPYKVAMPFLDSLVNKSTFYSNAFSFSYSSNKGITAMLAGLPTLTDIPLYHSGFTGIRRTSVGNTLALKGYQSAFFIGDNYDDFGFAKCCNWLGIQHYYSKTDIPGHKQMEKHSLGLHDEYVLDFMQQKIDGMQAPFLAIQYNISTHYPNDLPSGFKDRFPNINNTPQMKSMQYYNDCLQSFFKTAAMQSWYNNTVFIFCSDHWAQPHNKTIRIDEVESFRIPIFIFDPKIPAGRKDSSMVSQLDILNTMMYYGAVKDSFTSYGQNLADTSLPPNRTVFTKLNSAVYQAINNQYVLGFDAIDGKPLYLYDYKKDPAKKTNLLKVQPPKQAAAMILSMKAFLQTATKHYRNELP